MSENADTELRPTALQYLTRRDNTSGTTTYDKQGETATMTDQNRTTHEYLRDLLGRETSDIVTALGTGIDGSVMRIDTAYALDGNVSITTTYNTTDGGSGNIVNQVADTYNGFGLLDDESRRTGSSGEVDSDTPSVQYDYSSSAATPTLLVDMVYPNGRELDYGYDSGTDAAVDRPSYLEDGNSSTPLVDYGYLGLDTIDDVDLPEPGIDDDMGAKNDSGQLADVDQFAQAVDIIFAQTGGDVEQIKYGRNILGDATSIQRPLADEVDAYFDQLNDYNAEEELTSDVEGELNSTDDGIVSGTQGLAESWTLDGMGNWANYTQTVGATPVDDQDRQTNALNQISNYNDPSGDSTSAWAVPGYDAAGNMTTIPQPGNETTGLGGVYDAWNELVDVKSGSTIIAAYAYDGLGRRDLATAGGTTTAFYFDSSKQVIEERVAGATTLQNVWGLRSVSDLVLRDTATGGSGNLGINESGLNLRLYALQDANWNVIALVGYNSESSTWNVVERFTYTAYGTPTALNPDYTAYSGANYGWTVLFAAMDFDPATGLGYDTARWYNPSIGTFESTDPANASPNTYEYAANNPVNNTDPTGEQFARLWAWDPVRGDFVDQFSGMTRTQVNAMEAAVLGRQKAFLAGHSSWLNSYSNGFNTYLPGGRFVSSGLGSGIYAVKRGVGYSNAQIANESDAALTTQAVVGGVVLGGTAFVGGEALLGAGTFGGGVTVGTATTLGGAGAAGTAALESPEGQELLDESGALLEQAGEALEEEALNIWENEGGAVEQEAQQASEGEAAQDALGDAAQGDFSRPLTAEDLGVEGDLSELQGTFSVTGGRAVARIDMIRGDVQNPFQILKNLADVARQQGATTLRIEGTIANERLFGILQSRYGLLSSGATDWIDIPLQ